LRGRDFFKKPPRSFQRVGHQSLCGLAASLRKTPRRVRGL
jgi:hypothetical protein